MRNKKRRMEPFSFYDHTGISKHLEKIQVSLMHMKTLEKDLLGMFLNNLEREINAKQ